MQMIIIIIKLQLKRLLVFLIKTYLGKQMLILMKILPISLFNEINCEKIYFDEAEFSKRPIISITYLNY